jgi:hypothetical protein
MLHNPVTGRITASPKLFISIWGWWTFANVVGGLIGWVITAVSSLAIFGIAFIISWFVVGVCVGIAQYHVLSRHLSASPTNKITGIRSGSWIASTIIGVLLCFLVASEVPSLLYSLSSDMEAGARKLLGYVVGGLLYGVLQGLTLERTAKSVTIWGFVCALGWCLGAGISLLLAQSAVDWLIGYNYDVGSEFVLGPWDATYIVIAGTIGTTIFGLVTGPAIALLRWPKPAPSQPGTPGKPQTAQNDPNWS